MNPPLTGCRIVITRAPGQAGALQERLRALGADVLSFPTIAITPVQPARPCSLSAFDWVVFTSTNAVRYFFETQGDIPLPDGVQTAAVGQATAEALAVHGWPTSLTPDEYVAEALADGLLASEPDMRGKRFLLPRGNLSRDVVADALRQRGATVEEIEVYRNTCPEVSTEALDALDAFAAQLVVFTSPSTVVNFVALIGAPRLDRLKAGCHFAAIGPVTRRAAAQCGIIIDIEPRAHTIDGLVDAIVERMAPP